MKTSAGFVVGLVVVLAAAAAAPAQVPMTVSPGSPSAVTPTDARCPTFSWGGVEGAASYELVVYRVGEKQEEAEEVLRQSFAATVGSWTPSLDRCLERGGQYAWSIRAERGEGPAERTAPQAADRPAAAAAGGPPSGPA